VSRFVPIIHRGKIIGGELGDVHIINEYAGYSGTLSIFSGDKHFSGIALLLNGVGAFFDFPLWDYHIPRQTWRGMIDGGPGEFTFAYLPRILGGYTRAEARFAVGEELDIIINHTEIEEMCLTFGRAYGDMSENRTAVLDMSQARMAEKAFRAAEETFLLEYWARKFQTNFDEVSQSLSSPENKLSPDGVIGKLSTDNDTIGVNIFFSYS